MGLKGITKKTWSSFPPVAHTVFNFIRILLRKRRYSMASILLLIRLVPNSFPGSQPCKGKKAKLSLCLIKHHAMNRYRVAEVYNFTILDPSNRWRWVVSFTLRPLYTRGNGPQHPLDRGLGGPQSRSGRSGGEKSFLPLPGIEPEPSGP
jgi:hypothetical protein